MTVKDSRGDRAALPLSMLGKVASRASGTAVRTLGASFAVVLAIFTGCAVNPVTGRNELHLVSEQEEIAMGSKNYVPGQQQAGGTWVVEPEVTAYVREVGRKLAAVSDRKTLPYEFVILNDSTPNAWAMPGGKLALNRGLLYELKSEAELAAVISHEITHAAGRHSARGIETNMVLGAGAAVLSAATSDNRNSGLIDLAAGLGTSLFGMKYGRDLELEADHYGMIYMQRAGYDPRAAISLQETFVRLANNKSPNWLEGMFASHPPSQERVDANRKLAATMAAGGIIGEAEYRKRMAPLFKSKDAYVKHDEGRKALKAGDAKKALALADQALSGEPREAAFHGLRGDALTKLGRHAEAEQAYDEAIRRNPDYYAYYLGRGGERKRRGDNEGASADFGRANRLLPTSTAHNALAQLAMAQGRRTEALEHLRVAASADDDAGEEAGAALARLELPAAPGRYVATRVEQQGDRVYLTLRNTTPVPLRDVVIGFAHPAFGRHTLHHGNLGARQTQRLVLPWSASSLAGGRLQVGVVSAKVAE